jgi:hypothetical protein
MHPIKAFCKIPLHCTLECSDIITLHNQVNGLLVCAPLRGYPGRDIAFQTARVIDRAVVFYLV